MRRPVPTPMDRTLSPANSEDVLGVLLEALADQALGRLVGLGMSVVAGWPTRLEKVLPQQGAGLARRLDGRQQHAAIRSIHDGPPFSSDSRQTTNNASGRQVS